MKPFHERPCAAAGLTSYRYRGAYGWVMIGATDNEDALREAERSIDGKADPARLEMWDAVKEAYAAAFHLDEGLGVSYLSFIKTRCNALQWRPR